MKGRYPNCPPIQSLSWGSRGILDVLVREPSSAVAFASIEAFADHHPSGRKIIQILDKNPNKDPDKYDEEDLQHMRKVVSYCKRHLAQEEKAKQDTDSKSYKSLKNWGHDALKT